MRYADAASHASPHYILPPLFLCVPAQKAERNKTTKNNTFQHAETQNTTYGQPASRVARPQPIAAYRGPHHIEIRISIIHDKHDKRRNIGKSEVHVQFKVQKSISREVHKSVRQSAKCGSNQSASPKCQSPKFKVPCPLAVK
jgi:hypothetical protein